MINKYALDKFKKERKGITPTQWAALEKGTVAFEQSVFAGKPAWNDLLEMPAPELSDEEQSFFDNETEELCGMIDDWKIRSELHDLPPEVWSFLKEKRFFGMVIPKEYGGRGFSAQGHAAVVSKIATRSGTVAATAMVPNSLGPGELLVHYGTDAQKNHYLPRLADGRDIPCFALTSPQAGSDATNQKDEGVVFKGTDNKLYIRMNWDKRYTTLAPVATVIGVAFNLKDPDGLLGDKEDIGLTLALVDANTPGIERSQRHRPSGTPFQNGPHWGHDVVVPLDAIIGGKEQAGNGWNMLVDCLSIGRSISLPSGASGLARKATRVTGAYASIRQQFGMPLAEMEGVQERLARIGGLTYMIEAVRMLPLQDLDFAQAQDKAARPAVASAILKYHTTESARQIAIDAVDVHGGKAVMEGPDNPVIDLYHGIPVSITVEGANIMTRNLMIFGQGAFMAHPFLMKEMLSTEIPNEKEAEKTAGQLLRKHIGYVFNNAAGAIIHNLTRGYLTEKPASGPDGRYYQEINRLSSAFAFLTDCTLLTLGKGLMKRERTSARLGDVFSNLYMASAALRRFNLEGRQERDVPLMQWATQTCLHNAEQALFDLIENHPSKFIRCTMKPLLMTYGRRISKPSDRVDTAVARLISEPGEARDRLTDGIYLPKGDTEYMARLENALSLVHQALPYEVMIAKAKKNKLIGRDLSTVEAAEEAAKLNIISYQIKDVIVQAEAARDDIVQVNHFPMEWQGVALTPNKRNLPDIALKNRI